MTTRLIEAAKAVNRKFCDDASSELVELDAAISDAERQAAAVVAMEERDQLCNALQELLDFSDVLQGRHFVRSNQARDKAGKLLKQHTATE